MLGDESDDSSDSDNISPSGVSDAIESTPRVLQHDGSGQDLPSDSNTHRKCRENILAVETHQNASQK